MSDSIDDKELFAAAMSDEPDPDPATVEDAGGDGGEVKDAGDRIQDNRDPATGRFKAKDAKEQDGGEGGQQGQIEQPPANQGREDHRIPLAEHLSVRERAQAAERRAQELEQRLAYLERQQFEARQKPADEEPVDPWADPNAYISRQIEPLQRGQEAIVDRFSRALAVREFGAEAVSGALAELEGRMRSDPQARFEYQRIMASDLPYHELVTWHKRQSALKEIGDDPSAYREKLRQELLKDPEFVKQAIASVRQPPAGGQASQHRPETKIQLPPSLGRSTAAANNEVGRDDAELSDRELFQMAMRG